MRKTENKEYYQKIRERVHSVTITHYLNIDQDKELLDLETRRPDFGLIYKGKYVGIEVTEVRPHKYYNDKKFDLQAINNTLERLIRQRLDANKVKAFRIDVIPQESIYSGFVTTPRTKKEPIKAIKSADNAKNNKQVSKPKKL